jgi:glyoxylate carboligase
MTATVGNSPAQSIQTPMQYAIGNIVNEFILGIPLTPVSVAANTTVEQSFVVNGILPGDFIEVNKPSLQAGLGIINTRAATNALLIGFANTTASPIVPTAGEVYQVCISRPMAQQVSNGLPSSLPLLGD